MRQALSELDLSQAKAAERSGIPQGHITEIISGKRALSRESLRAFGALGIPADFLLGLEKDFVPLGQSRSVETLEDDVAAYLARQLHIVAPPQVEGSTEPYFWIIQGEGALALAVDALRIHATRILAEEYERRKIMVDLYAMRSAADLLMGAIDKKKFRKEHAPLLGMAMRLNKLCRESVERMKQLPPTRGEPVQLAPTVFTRISEAHAAGTLPQPRRAEDERAGQSVPTESQRTD